MGHLYIKLIILFLAICSIGAGYQEEPYYGLLLGEIPDFEAVGISGKIYAVNSSHLQVIGFHYEGQVDDLTFWMDSDFRSSGLSPNGQAVVSLPKFLPNQQYNGTERIVLLVPDFKRIGFFHRVGLFSPARRKDFGFVKIPSDIRPPAVQFLPGFPKTTSHKPVMSGPIQIMDRRTIKIYGFKFNAVGSAGVRLYGSTRTFPYRNNLVEVKIRHRDEHYKTPFYENFIGDKDLILELPPTHTVYQLKTLTVFKYSKGLPVAFVKIAGVSDNIPPYVPVTPWHDKVPTPVPWEQFKLAGRKKNTKFTFELGPSGGLRGYVSKAKSRPSDGRVWYVNGYLAPEIWLERNVEYTFRVFGGEDNQLYISDDIYGGLQEVNKLYKKPGKMPAEMKVNYYAGLKLLKQVHKSTDEFVNPPFKGTAGPLCEWIHKKTDHYDEPDRYPSFMDFKKHLRRNCTKGEAGEFKWMPDESIPDLVYYQSYNNPNMGWKIFVVDSIPKEVMNPEEQHEKSIRSAKAVSGPRGSTSYNGAATRTSVTFDPYIMMAFSVFCVVPEVFMGTLRFLFRCLGTSTTL